ncbi:unnamed protein product [Mytilus coruscus]|uniref:Uncharacterized protein n=1 Tax=Mytilus coruscus TaxID=42192 RepID=A0A6J8E5F7_MYTCO|nr:unnamed protein product [Mytilus coruscus]
MSLGDFIPFIIKEYESFLQHTKRTSAQYTALNDLKARYQMAMLSSKLPMSNNGRNSVSVLECNVDNFASSCSLLQGRQKVDPQKHLGHRKGSCDGIGITCKRTAAEAVKQRRISIKIKNEKAIPYVFYSDEDYNSAAEYFTGKVSKTVAGTMKLPSIRTEGMGKICVLDLSCYCEVCRCGSVCVGWTVHYLPITQNEAVVNGVVVKELPIVELIIYK